MPKCSGEMVRPCSAAASLDHRLALGGDRRAAGRPAANRPTAGRRAAAARSAPPAHPDLERVLERPNGKRRTVDGDAGPQVAQLGQHGAELDVAVARRPVLDGPLDGIVEPDDRRDEEPAQR